MIIDKLNAKERVQSIISLIKNSDDSDLVKYKNKSSTVIAITACYGKGKSFFCKIFQKEINQDEFHVIYIDMWKSSYLPPFLHLSKQLTRHLGNSKKLKEIVLQANSYVNLNFNIKGVGVNVNKIIEDVFNKNDDPINNFNKTIKQYTKNKPIIFLLDEGDRCDYSYVKQYLTEIHHFFDISNVFFLILLDESYIDILSNNRKKSIIEKFIDIKIPLYKNSLNLLENISNNTPIENILNEFTDNRNEVNIYKEIVDILDLSLRDLSQIKLSFILLEKETHTKIILEKFPQIITFFMLALKQKYYSEYCRILTSTEYENILKVMDKFFSNKTKFIITIKYRDFSDISKREDKKECLPSELFNKLLNPQKIPITCILDNYNKKGIENIIFTSSYLILKANTDITSITNPIYNVNSCFDNGSKKHISLSKSYCTEYLSSILLLSI